MKRCPECLFIYPESDTRCDFDNTALVVVDEAELEAATTEAKPPTKRKRASTKNNPAAPKAKSATKKRKRKTTAVAVLVGLLLGIAAFIVYYRLSHRTQNIAQLQATPITNAEPIVAPTNSPSALPTASPSPTAIPVQPPTAKPGTDRIVTAHSTTTVAPISTSGPGMGKKLGGKPVILLTSGARISADEVWRTRDGVWYRRDGIVTLLKRGQVKAIVNQ